jgi:hypothetical protein
MTIGDADPKLRRAIRQADTERQARLKAGKQASASDGSRI